MPQLMHTEIIYVSCGQRYWQGGESAESNAHWYDDLASEEGVGHNLRLETTFKSQVEGMDGLNAKLKNLADPLDHSFLNSDLEEFSETVPSVENIARYWFERVQAQPEFRGTIQAVKVREGKRSWAQYDGKLLTYGEAFKISCVHRHHNPELSEKQNKELYDKCAVTHGHEYTMEINVTGEPDPKFGVLMPRQKLRQIVNDKIVRVYDKSFLNEKIGNTSGEIIALHFSDILKKELPKFETLAVRETRKNSFYV